MRRTWNVRQCNNNYCHTCFTKTATVTVICIIINHFRSCFAFTFGTSSYMYTMYVISMSANCGSLMLFGFIDQTGVKYFLSYLCIG